MRCGVKGWGRNESHRAGPLEMSVGCSPSSFPVPDSKANLLSVEAPSSGSEMEVSKHKAGSGSCMYAYVVVDGFLPGPGVQSE